MLTYNGSLMVIFPFPLASIYRKLDPIKTSLEHINLLFPQAYVSIMDSLSCPALLIGQMACQRPGCLQMSLGRK